MQRSPLVVVFALLMAACGGGADTTSGIVAPADGATHRVGRVSGRTTP